MLLECSLRTMSLGTRCVPYNLSIFLSTSDPQHIQFHSCARFDTQDTGIVRLLHLLSWVFVVVQSCVYQLLFFQNPNCLINEEKCFTDGD